MSTPAAIFQKLAYGLILLLAPIAGIPAPSGTAPAPVAAEAAPSIAPGAFEQTAIIANTAAAAPLAPGVALPEVIPGLLPEVHLAAHPIPLKPTVLSKTNFPRPVALKIDVGVTTAASAPETATTTTAPVIIKIVPKIVAATSTAASAPKVSATPSAPAPKTPAAASGIPAVVTPQWVFDNTSLSLSQKLDGTFRVLLTTKAGTQNIQWHLTDTALGGDGASANGAATGLPQFSASYSCNPIADTPAPDALDPNMIFHIRTSYTCTVSLTPLSGTDRRTQSKDFSFETGPGQLVVTAPSSMNTVLKNDQNDGGFVFSNQDSQAVTVTGLTVDLSYTGLSIDSGPLVLRISDPDTGKSLFDYHLENFPADSARPFTLTQSGALFPLSFTIPANGHKLLTVQALGVHKMSILGLDPSLKIILRGVSVNQTNVKTILTLAQIQWSCVLPTTAYDPNATTGAFATGQACKD